VKKERNYISKFVSVFHFLSTRLYLGLCQQFSTFFSHSLGLDAAASASRLVSIEFFRTLHASTGPNFGCLCLCLCLCLLQPLPLPLPLQQRQLPLSAALFLLLLTVCMSFITYIFSSFEFLFI
jgi:hypothetical protein